MQYNPSVIKTDMQDTQQRFLVFVDKLKTKLQEFAEASIPELREMNANKDDEDSYHRMRSAVLGQVESIRKKAYDVLEEKISNYTFPLNDPDLRDQYYEMRRICRDAYNGLDELVQHYRREIEATFSEDLEAQYQSILDEFENIKDKFSCTQCGGNLTIDKIYFTTTYIACSYCQTQNTFEPSSQAKSLEYLGRSLAEQRSLPLLQHYQEALDTEGRLFQQKHHLEMEMSFERDELEKNNKSIEFRAIVQHWEKAREDSINRYENYLRGMFDEWNKINPALRSEHERFYNRMLNDYMETRLKD
ncbi:hypothetical protein LZQ00_12350 [Sphingobacterium sp. SRCM116780]|uniref:hypothetical protein n=1 Tax=Sphingobacterium sp. SRCM116780 TaxID=2907623 RepID=UPI001F3072FD|nr:hypothetical protein [Sphingobacterium sp. SRCM116780]UIR55070.1 hypothetical protein LZQ00_12350 [Sphingobacterium sp. SRCM116780]